MAEPLNDINDANGDAWVRTTPERAVAIAQAYRCGHCNSDPAEARRLPDGNVAMVIYHDDGCPVLTGVVLDTPDTMRAVEEAGR